MHGWLLHKVMHLSISCPTPHPGVAGEYSRFQGRSQTFIWVGSFRRKVAFFEALLYGLHYGVQKHAETRGSGGILFQEIF